MFNKLPKEHYFTKYSLMVAAQANNGGFTLTMRELMTLWGYHSTSSVAYCLDRMFKQGFLHRKQYGKTYKYRPRYIDDVPQITMEIKHEMD